MTEVITMKKETTTQTTLEQTTIEAFNIVESKKVKLTDKLEKKVNINNSAGMIRVIDNIEGYILTFNDLASAKAYKRFREQGDRVIIECDEFIITNENGTINKSQTIRKMFRENFSKKQIADSLGIRYQFVYNVLKKDADFEMSLQELEDDSE